MKNSIKVFLAIALCGFVSSTNALTHSNINPESATGSSAHNLLESEKFMVVAANKFASQAGYDILNKGGNAIDAAIAMQMVLNVVEPQSSGIGGGAFLLHYDNINNELVAWDGRETAPASANEDRFMNGDKPMPFFDVVNSGLSVATPGLLKMLYDAHQESGRLPWPQLFEHAINLAENGFPISERLHKLLSDNNGLKDNLASFSYFYETNGSPWPVGYKLKNPQLAQTFKIIANTGIDDFYSGDIAKDIAYAVQNQKLAGDLSLKDLQTYTAIKTQALCYPYKQYKLCGMPPPSSGPLAVMQMLGILSHTPISDLEPDSVLAVHYFSEAGRLAFADRGHYVADPMFVDVPVAALLDNKYLKQRAALINDDHAMGTATAGNPTDTLSMFGQDNTIEAPATTHLSVVDGSGNVVSMTSSIESAFGSKILVNGFLLNNELTDFAFNPVDSDGIKAANRVEPNKRPRSSMAPMIIFKDDKPYMAIGSPGGSAIINYVAKTVLGVLDWGLDVQQAIDLPNYGSRNYQTELETNRSITSLSKELEQMGHDVAEMDFPSGLHGIVIKSRLLQGGADPRREGLALGD